ncbi:hypothetical protein MDA_GLEAN10021500 [Myotis davidii]|uniref:Uncharacterized protein n=1 Tax=Myotis davidii TaxID=225400 RepID=L5LSF6_MYODS|nr:hypothetical protein MDA_GLEAN10021500 [Myotis davidii]
MNGPDWERSTRAPGLNLRRQQWHENRNSLAAHSRQLDSATAPGALGPTHHCCRQ